MWLLRPPTNPPPPSSPSSSRTTSSTITCILLQWLVLFLQMKIYDFTSTTTSTTASTSQPQQSAVRPRQLLTTSSSTTSRINWNRSSETFPASIVMVHSIEDVIDCITNVNDVCPSPIRPVGSMTSVTSCNENEGGTLLDMTGLNRILNYETATGIVTLEAGVVLSDLHAFLLQNHFREISFQPEMGLATVGSLAVATAKDNSVNGPGYFNALITRLKYVNDKGEVVQVDASTASGQDFLCTWGLLGVVVEVSLQTRPASQILTKFKATYLGPGILDGLGGTGLFGGSGNSALFESPADKAFQILQQSRERADNVYFLLSPHQNVVVTMERYSLVDNNNNHNSTVSTNDNDNTQSPQQSRQPPQQHWFYRRFNSFFLMIIQRIAYYTIKQGVPYSDSRLDFTLKNLGIVDTFAKYYSFWFTAEVVHYRTQLTYRYAPPSVADQNRLDFSMYFFDDITQLERIFKETYQFTQQWYKRTGFAPSGFNMYFVKRTGKSTCGMFAGSVPEAISWAMDPYHNNPSSQEWKDFVQALTAKNLQWGAKVSPTQTRFLQPTQFSYHQSLQNTLLQEQQQEQQNPFTNTPNDDIPSSSSKPISSSSARFLTPFYQQFL